MIAILLKTRSCYRIGDSIAAELVTLYELTKLTPDKFDAAMLIFRPHLNDVRYALNSGVKADIARGRRMGWTGRAPAQ